MKNTRFFLMLFYAFVLINKALSQYDVIIGVSDGQGVAYRNIGSLESPIWETNPSWNLPDVGTDNVPCIVDLDNDGDLDVLIGASTGVCFGYENVGSIGNPIWQPKPLWDVPDVGICSAPHYADLDKDGDFDLMVGCADGLTYGFRNVGTVNAPIWAAESSWDIPDLGSASKPFLSDFDYDGDFDILIGMYTGVALGYENIGSVYSPIWIAKSLWNTPDVGSDARPYGSDLDKDGDIDLLIGETLGNINGYKNIGTIYSPVWIANNLWDMDDQGTDSAPVVINFSGSNLPISLLSINVKRVNNSILLSWQTSSEVNNDCFYIERSFDALIWEKIGSIKGVGNSNIILSYSFVDNNPIYGVSYYRLKQVDFDGEFEYSTEVSILYENNGSAIFAYPNPFIDKVVVDLKSEEFGLIYIYNNLGQIVNDFLIITELKENKFVIDLSKVANGVYYIKTKNNCVKIYKW